MATIDPAALERVLTSIDLRVGSAHRERLSAGGRTELAGGTVALVYVAAGSVHGLPTADCGLEVGGASKAIGLALPTARDLLSEGTAFLTLGARSVMVRSEHGAELMIAELELSAAAAILIDVLPSLITVTDFARLEPAAAALARSMGNDAESCPLRSGDPVICRLMTMTLLMTVIRAWAENGCAPTGWPSPSSDRFLDRVIDAIHEQPGREWTVDALASVGAMSRSVFAERFRRTFGHSPASYVTGVRMDAAKRMLESGQSVSATSRSLGYASDEGFSRAFRRSTGMNPSAWRKTSRAVISA